MCPFIQIMGKVEKSSKAKPEIENTFPNKPLFTWKQEIIYKGSLLVVLSEEQEVTVLFPFGKNDKEVLIKPAKFSSKKNDSGQD